jgi:hypothetical protein
MPPAKEPKSTLKTTMLLRGVPRVVLQHFKALCALKGVSMTKKMISMMREFIKECTPK